METALATACPILISSAVRADMLEPSEIYRVSSALMPLSSFTSSGVTAKS